MTQADDPVLLAHDGAVARLTLNRPDKLNALSTALLKRLAERLEEVAASPARALLITGEGRSFSSGADLSDSQSLAGRDLGEMLMETYWPVVERLRALPLPVIAACTGPVAGAGVSIALACDIVLAARSARFMLAFAGIGLLPDAGASWFVPRLIGHGRATRMMMTGEPLTAEDALASGLIGGVCEDERLLEEAGALAAALAEKPTRALAAIKRTLDAAATNDLAAQVRLEAVEQGALGRTADFAEGVTAFLQKRAPVFRGC